MYKKHFSGAFKRKRVSLVRNIIKKKPSTSGSENINHKSSQQLLNRFDEPQSDEANNIHNAEMTFDDEAPNISHANEILDLAIEEASNVRSANEITNDNQLNNSDGERVIEIDIVENQHKEKIIGREFPFNKITFQSALAAWAIDNGIKHEQLRGLLKVWNDHVPLPSASYRLRL